MKLLRLPGRLLRTLGRKLGRLGMRAIKLAGLATAGVALLFVLDMLLNPSDNPRRP